MKRKVERVKRCLLSQATLFLSLFRDSVFPWYLKSRIPFSFNKKRVIADSNFYIVLFLKGRQKFAQCQDIFGNKSRV